MKDMMKEMQHEVLGDLNMHDDMMKAKRRREQMMMTPAECELYCENPQAARSLDHPAYPMPDYGEDK